MRKHAITLVAALALLAGCNRNESGGPAEKAGRSVDRALDKTGQAIEKAGRELQDASKGKK
jgi:predicted small secreted protein